tara:strand:+ start:159 stop:620 length:462 start_codon:yes stop_codon:yes gene_type:complete
MTIEELNKLIKEELEAYLGEDEEEGGDDIEVTTDEPEDKGEEALDTLRQIFNMLKPMVEPEEEEPEMDMDSDMDDEEEADEDMKEGKDDEKDEDMKEGKDDEKDEDMKKENMDHPNYRADYVKDVAHNAEKIKGGLNESVDSVARFKKLANIK